jgi:hypothetical protein
MKGKKKLSIQMSTQAKMFLETCSPEDRAEFLNTIEKIASGELKGKLLDPERIPDVIRQAVEAADREFTREGEKPTS